MPPALLLHASSEGQLTTTPGSLLCLDQGEPWPILWATRAQWFRLAGPASVFAAECLGKCSNKFTASLMSNLLSGALRKQRAELTRLN